MKKKLITIFVLTGGLLLTIAQIVSAETGLEKAKINAAKMAGSGIINGSIEKLVGAVIGVAIGLVAVLFIIMIIRAGIAWMLSRDDSAKIAHAKAVIMAAAIGLILTVGAYAIVNFIITEINKKTTQNNQGLGGSLQPDNNVQTADDNTGQQVFDSLKIEKCYEDCDNLYPNNEIQKTLSLCYADCAGQYEPKEGAINGCRDQCDADATARNNTIQACKNGCYYEGISNEDLNEGW